MADGLGLSGWVRNRPDGSVEALCSGSAESVRQMIDWLRVGPESALVDKIEITDLEDQDVVHDQFTIRY